MLLASAGLLLRSLELLQRVSPGFTTERTVTMQLLLPQTRYSKSEQMIAFYHRLHDEVAAVPSVTASAVSTTLPMTGSDIGMGFVPEGRPVDPKARTSPPSSASALTTSPRSASGSSADAASPTATTSTRRMSWSSTRPWPRSTGPARIRSASA